MQEGVAKRRGASGPYFTVRTAGFRNMLFLLTWVVLLILP